MLDNVTLLNGLNRKKKHLFKTKMKKKVHDFFPGASLNHPFLRENEVRSGMCLGCIYRITATQLLPLRRNSCFLRAYRLI